MHHRVLTETQTLHDDPLARKTCITMELHTHNPIAWYASRKTFFCRQCPEERELLRTRLPECHGIDGFQMRWIGEEGYLEALSRLSRVVT